ncbi:head-tail connector protein [Yangia mangrovi]|uniref:Head-tail connector protein n=1 Tax=Alloyangia mangrovi TaxID=1779329 RepID=A0ABT2KPD6_9RHOB|nr:head-tail connector protein [Alloyangia mangrovi]MCT4372714.1 head-tail connector protein [Alloyangia mangrovi]
MMVIEETQVPDTVLPLAALKRQLRMGSGFAEEGLQDDVLYSFLRAALAAIEARTGKALLLRSFLWTLHGWRDVEGAALPLAPVTAVSRLTLVDRYGVAQDVASERYRLEVDAFTPMLRPQRGTLPDLPSGGTAEVRFTAGYGAGFDDLPPDLGQAVLLLAAHYYEYRDETVLGQGCMPFGVTALIARYRPLRLGFSA